jgi:hypothetical protein
MVRILRISSTPELVKGETDRLRMTLKRNGYPPHIIRSGIREGQFIVNRLKRQLLIQQQQQQQQQHQQQKRKYSSRYHVMDKKR